MNQKEVIVIGNNYASLLGTVRALGRAGCRAYVIKTVNERQSLFKKLLSPDRYSRYVSGYDYMPREPRGEIVDLLLRKFSGRDSKPCILPVDDYASALVDEYAQQLAPHFVFPHVRSGSIARLMDKDVQKRLAAQAGLDVIKGWTVRLEGGKFTLPEGIEYPCFIKAQVSILGKKTDMFACRNREELSAALERIAQKRDCPMLIERYVNIHYEYGIAGYCDGKRVFMPGLIKKLSVGQGMRAGVTMEGCVMPIDRFPGLKEKATAMMRGLDYVGLFDIDLIESGGVLYFSELNLRLGAFGYAMTPLGSSLPAMIAERLLLGETKQGAKPVDAQHLFLNEKVLEEEFSQGRMSVRTYREKLSRYPLRFIKDGGDPCPYVMYKLREAMYTALRCIGKKKTDPAAQ